MRRFTMAAYIKVLKTVAKNTNISDEEFVRELFNLLIIIGNVKDKNDSQLDLDNVRVSRLLAQKDDVPCAMKKALAIYNNEESLEDGFEDFINDYLDENKMPSALNTISDIIQSDININAGTKFKLRHCKIISCVI